MGVFAHVSKAQSKQIKRKNTLNSVDEKSQTFKKTVLKVSTNRFKSWLDTNKEKKNLHLCWFKTFWDESIVCTSCLSCSASTCSTYRSTSNAEDALWSVCLWCVCLTGPTWTWSSALTDEGLGGKGGRRGGGGGWVLFLGDGLHSCQ